MLFFDAIQTLDADTRHWLVARLERASDDPQQKSLCTPWRRVGRVRRHGDQLVAELTRASSPIHDSWYLRDLYARATSLRVVFGVEVRPDDIRIVASAPVSAPIGRDDRRHGGPRPVRAYWPTIL